MASGGGAEGAPLLGGYQEAPGAGARGSTELYDLEESGDEARRADEESGLARGGDYDGSDDEEEDAEDLYEPAGRAGRCWVRAWHYVGRLLNLRSDSAEEDEEAEEAPHDYAAIKDGIQTACLLILAIVALGVGLIYLEFVLVPLVMAVFFVYLFQPGINYMVGKKKVFFCRLHFPRPIAVLIIIMVVILVLALLAAAIYFSVMEIVNDSQKYLDRFDEIYDQVLEWAEELGFDQEEVLGWLPEISIGEVALIVIGQLLNLIPQAILCVLFTIYMLLDYKEAKNKSRLQKHIDRQIRKYIVIKVIISLVTGLLVGAVLAALQVDMFFLFALLTFLLNFIPSVGSMIAVALPLPVVILDPDQAWWSMLLALLVPGTIQMVIGNVVEPSVMGKSMNMSAVAVLSALSFWGTVWGIVGAFMSVPLTVMLHMWLKSIPSPFAQFLGDLVGGQFNLFEDAETLQANERAKKKRTKAV